MPESVTLDDIEPRTGDGWVAPGLVEKVDGKWRLVGSRCPCCGASFFPVTSQCAFCLGEDLATVHLPGRGSIHSVTTVEVAPPGFEAPYSLGWVDIDDVRVFGTVVGEEGSVPAIGDEVETVVTVVRRDDAGAPIFGHAFRPVREST